nr:MAG TPA: hypothetical protein [Crassvirales sp.]
MTRVISLLPWSVLIPIGGLQLKNCLQKSSHSSVSIYVQFLIEFEIRFR